MYGLFKDWNGRSGYKNDEVCWNFYTDIDQQSVDWIEKLDKVTDYSLDFIHTCDNLYTVYGGTCTSKKSTRI